MDQHQQEASSRSFGVFLRRVRERRRLSLDAVEELSTGFVERVTKSHLSRIENGQATPSFPRLFALSRIYGVPVSALAERFELDLAREQIPPRSASESDEDLREEATRLRMGGRYVEALAVVETLLERRLAAKSPKDATEMLELRLHKINCVMHLGRHGLAKDECEELLGEPQLSVGQRLRTLECFAICCVNLGRHTVAMMALEQAEKFVGTPEAPQRMEADLAAIRGKIQIITGNPKDAANSYRNAVALYDAMRDSFESCRARINLAYALMEAGDRRRAVEHLETALAVAESSAYDRQQAVALGHLGVLAFREERMPASEALLIRSNAIARSREYTSVVFRNCFYLWKIAKARGDSAAAKANERTLRSYVSRVEDYLPEAHEFRALLAGEGA